MGDPNQITPQKSLNISCVGIKVPETNKTITGINGETFKFFYNGRFADVKGNKGSSTILFSFIFFILTPIKFQSL